MNPNKSEGVKSVVHLGDCLQAMREMPDKCFSLAWPDPPYGIGEDGRNNHTRNKLAKAKDYRLNSRYDNDAPPYEFFKELKRVSVNQIVWGANHFISRIPEDSSCWIIWDKDNSGDFADCELAWTSFKSAVRKVKIRWNGMLQEDMGNKEERIHPNHKPIALYRWLLQNYAKQGDTILDTHVGSGSSRIAAYQLGFDFVGYEIDADYHAAQEARFSDFKKKFCSADVEPIGLNNQIKIF